MVERIAASGIFGASERQLALLRYLVTEELSGRGENLKAYSIGADVLGRGTRFDPGQDAIVRVEIGRLRKSLDLYFATKGRDEPLRILIEKGNYRPRFIDQMPPDAPAVPPPEAKLPRSGKIPARRFWVWLAALAAAAIFATSLTTYLSLSPVEEDVLPTDTPQLIIAQPDVAGMREQTDAIRYGLQAALAQELRKQPWLSITIGDQINGVRRATFTLRPALSVSGEQWTMTAILTKEPEREVVWTGRYDGRTDLLEPDALRQAIAVAVNRDIGPLSGPIAEAIAQQSDATSAAAPTPFSCMINVRRFLRHNMQRQFVDAKACVIRHHEASPTLIELRAILAYLLVLEAVQPNLSPLPTLVGGVFMTTREARREALLNESDKVQRGASPTDRVMLQQRLVLAACRGRPEAVREHLPALLAFQSNTSDPYIIRAILMGPMLGDWKPALEFEARALSLTAHPTPRYQIISGIKAAMDNDPIEALRLVTRIPMQNYALGHLLVGLFAAEAGALQQVRNARNKLFELGYQNPTAFDNMITDSCYSDEVKARLRRALKVFIDIRTE